MRLRQAVGERNHHQRPVPEILVLVLLHQPGANTAGLADIDARQARLRQFTQQKVHANLLRLGHLEELGQLAARHFDHPNNARCDLSHPHTARVAGGEVDLDGLGPRHAGRLCERKTLVDRCSHDICFTAL